MPKAKSKATLLVADGAGGMVQVQDRRFQAEAGNWPVSFEVPQEQADTWLRYLQAACERRDWISSSMAQLEARQNSGSITLNNGAPGKPQIAVVWERKRNGPLTVQARHVGGLAMAEADVKALFDEINDHSQRRVTQRVYRRGMLEYERLPFRGETWLDETLRLGPPTVQDEQTLIGPQVVIVDALIDIIAMNDAPWVFRQRLEELATFLCVAMGTAIRLPEGGQAWTFTEGVADCAVRYLGYCEPNFPQQMPARDTCRPVPLRPVTRPDFSLRGIIIGTDSEQTLPADISDLWRSFRALPEDRRRQFLQSASKWQEALIHAKDKSTLSYVLMVVACEALKPWEPEFRRHNIYDVTGQPIQHVARTTQVCQLPSRSPHRRQMNSPAAT